MSRAPERRYQRLFVFITFLPLFVASLAFSCASLGERVALQAIGAPQSDFADLDAEEGVVSYKPGSDAANEDETAPSNSAPLAKAGDPTSFPILNSVNIVVGIGMVLYGIYGLVTFSRTGRLQAHSHTNAVSLARRNDEAFSFYLTLVMPLLTLTLRLSWGAFAAYCVVVAFLMVLLERTHTCYTNPVVVAMGYNIYEATLYEGNARVLLVSRDHLTTDQLLELVRLDDGYYFARVMPRER